MMKNILIIAAAVTLGSASVAAQDRSAAGACAADIRTHCAEVERGQGRIRGCLKEHLKDLSEPCQARLAKAAERSRPCAADIKQHCGDVRPGGGRVRDCLKSALANLSDACKERITKAGIRRRQD